MPAWRRTGTFRGALREVLAELHLLPEGRLTPHAPTDGVRRAGDALVDDEGALPL